MAIVFLSRHSLFPGKVGATILEVASFLAGCRLLVRTLIFYYSHLCKWLSSNFVNFVFIFQLSPLFRKNFSQLQKSRYCPWKLPLLNISFFWTLALNLWRCWYPSFSDYDFVVRVKLIYIFATGFQKWSFKCLKSCQTNQNYLWWLK